MAVALVVVQLRAQLTQAQHRQVHGRHTALGLVYITDHYAEHGQALLDMLRRDLPDVLRWVGTVTSIPYRLSYSSVNKLNI